jgi:hypothetical protein
MRAAVAHIFALDTMADNPTTTVATLRSQFLNSTLKTIEFKDLVSNSYLKRFVVRVPARGANAHVNLTIRVKEPQNMFKGGRKAMTSTSYPIEREENIRYCVTKSRI